MSEKKEPAPDALREAFEVLRWRWDMPTDGSKTIRIICSACGYIIRSPEVHAPGCIVGKVIGGNK